MKKAKFINLSISTLIYLNFLNIFTIFTFHSFPAYSKDNSTESINTNEDFDCYKKYFDRDKPEEYPEAKSYCHALANTKIAESSKIWRNLTAITKDNTKIIWENQKVNSRLLVAIWTSWDGYEKQVGQESVQIYRDTWVTVAPELQEFCKEFSKNQIKNITLPYRLNQLLGLPPESSEKNNKRRVVQIWVEPRDLFRPTPDPEITDHEAELNFPELNWFITISDKYKYWFLKQLMTNNYPWTKLGYTYDWGKRSDWLKIDSRRPVNVGLSEFIIRENASVKVNSVSTVKDYCK